MGQALDVELNVEGSSGHGQTGMNILRGARARKSHFREPGQRDLRPLGTSP